MFDVFVKVKKFQSFVFLICFLSHFSFPIMTSQRKQTLAHFIAIHSELGNKVAAYLCNRENCSTIYSGTTSVSKALAAHVAKHAEADAAATRLTVTRSC